MKYKKGDLIIEECGDSFYLIQLNWVRKNEAHGFILDEVTKNLVNEGNGIVEKGYEKRYFEEPQYTNDDKDCQIYLDRCQLVEEVN